MTEEPATEIQLLRSHKTTLIEILSADADFVLQHADSRHLLSHRSYQQVKACRIPSEKVTELLDCIIQKGPEAAQGMLELLKDQALQETFPMLDFIKDLQVSTLNIGEKRTARKRRETPYLHESIPSKKIKGQSHFTHTFPLKPYNNVKSSHTLSGCVSLWTGSRLIEEKQLMTVARAIGRCWREIGRLALDIKSVKLEQIEEDHSLHVERVFAMLRHWQTCQREKATAARLHSLLSQNDWALPPESIDFLLETD
ncbi:hypothetical protein EXN66_Car012585 [Channa argus]|uniref:Death domain-containing protein CRADD n=1 Tax=Channa argus TaxID=215402 RepID=A0A6G1Q3Z3_CHAAH|nr:hypothetical protein EXN66_Car012585 [Channa argus]